MKAFSGFDEAKESARQSGGAKLPKGGYVAKILGAKADEEKGILTVQFDIAEGQYKGFFQKQFEENTSENKKYKGQTKIWLPKEDGTEKDAWTKKTFAKWTNAIEDSNEGYHWDWNEAAWKDKKIGLVFGETGTNIEGKNIVYTEVHYPVAVAKVKDIKPETIKFKAKKGYNPNANGETDFMNVPDNIAEELPF